MPEATRWQVGPATAAVAASTSVLDSTRSTASCQADCASVRHVDRLVDLVSIFEPEVQVLVHERPLAPEITTCLDNIDASAAAFRGFRQVVNVAAGLSEMPLPKVPQIEVFGADIGHLAELYADLLGCAQIGMRLEGLRHVMCPGWHCDHTGIRMLCTYRGPGTQWLGGTGIDRTTLPDSVADQPPDGSAGAGAIVLLKGTLWQGNAGRGAIHRSPTPGQGMRWLLVLDAIW